MPVFIWGKLLYKHKLKKNVGKNMHKNNYSDEEKVILGEQAQRVPKRPRPRTKWIKTLVRNEHAKDAIFTLNFG